MNRSTVLITGCSSGFGLATAKLFLARDWNVVATMRSPKPGLLEPDARLLVTALDVTNPDSIDQAIAASVQRFGRIDCLVNNAGIGMFAAHETAKETAIRQVFETNTFGVMAANRAIIPHLRENARGTIINVTSSVGIAPMPLVAAYAASKNAIEGFSEALSYELAHVGVRVKVVQPGMAPATSFGANSGDRCDFQVPPAYAEFAQRYLGSMQTAKAFTHPEDVAEAVYRAATDRTDQLRYPAGADSAMLAQLRDSLDEREFLARIRSMCGVGDLT